MHKRQYKKPMYKQLDTIAIRIRYLEYSYDKCKRRYPNLPQPLWVLPLPFAFFILNVNSFKTALYTCTFHQFWCSCVLKWLSSSTRNQGIVFLKIRKLVTNYQQTSNKHENVELLQLFTLSLSSDCTSLAYSCIWVSLCLKTLILDTKFKFVRKLETIYKASRWVFSQLGC